MKLFRVLVGALSLASVASCGPEPSSPPVALTPVEQYQHALDSVNIATRLYWQRGGRGRFYVIHVDTAAPPIFYFVPQSR